MYHRFVSLLEQLLRSIFDWHNTLWLERIDALMQAGRSLRLFTLLPT
jgi:hypothetical protein